MNINSHSKHFCSVILLLLFLTPVFADDYWQQEVNYEIHVTLDDSAHTLSAHEIISYTNNSPDTLDFLWFHLWPNAYKNNETAYAKQKLEHFSTRFHFAKEKDRGYIDSLDFSVNDIPVKWEYHPEWIDVAKVYLNEPLLPGKSVTLETPFFVNIPKVFSRLGHTGKHYEITQWYPKPAVYDKEGWHPIPYLDMGEFYSEFGSFNVYLTLPEDYRVMATGDIVNGEAEYAWLDSLAEEGEKLHTLDKKAFKKKIRKIKKEIKKAKKKKSEKEKTEKQKMKTLHFHQENVHDFAWFADRSWIVRKGELWLSDSTRKVTLWSMYLPRNAKLWEKSLEYIHDAGYWYSKFYGDYPYNHITAVDGDMSAGGGMEYPNITVISSGGSKDLLEFVIMHEVGHNWFYGILGSDERDHAWLDEGLNEYSNIRYWEKKYPERNGQIIVQDFTQNKMGIGKNLDFRWVMGYLGYQGRAVTGDDQPIELPSIEFHRGNYGSIVYGKTAIFTRYLQHYLGEEKIDEIMQDYYENWKFKHPQPEDFWVIFEKHVDEDLSWYFDDAINDTKVIDYGLTSLKEGEVTVVNFGTMTPPIELGFYDSEGREIVRKWFPGFDGKKKVNTPMETKRVIVDPDNYMPDINRWNNTTSKPFKFLFVFDQPTFQHREVNLLPWLSGNAYNKLTFGFVGYSGFVPGYFYGLGFTPQWDFEHNKVVGNFSVQRTFYRILGFRTLTVSGKGGDYAGRKGANLSVFGVVRKPIISTPYVTMSGNLYLHNIKPEAVNPTYYRSGEYVVTNISLSYYHRPNPFLSYNGSLGLSGSVQGASFARFSSVGRLRLRYSKKLNLRCRIWAGTFVNDRDIPTQYQTWMGGGVDPNFEQSWVFNRTDDGGRSPVNVYDEQFIQEGPALRGRAIINGIPVVSTSNAWGINVDQNLPFVPVGLYADAGGATDLNEILMDAGLRFSLPFIRIYIPLYQSWDNKTVPTDIDWILDRARFEINVSIPMIRR